MSRAVPPYRVGSARIEFGYRDGLFMRLNLLLTYREQRVNFAGSFITNTEKKTRFTTKKNTICDKKSRFVTKKNTIRDLLDRRYVTFQKLDHLVFVKNREIDFSCVEKKTISPFVTKSNIEILAKITRFCCHGSGHWLFPLGAVLKRYE